jgi:hypothetical protein
VLQPRCCEPLEPSITLPKLLTNEMMEEERSWLATSISDWLDAEWKQPEVQPVHAAIGRRVSEIYARQRMEGEDELVGILLAIGQELESFDMSSSFVGPFIIANKVAELLLQHRVGKRDPNPTTYSRSPNSPVWSMDDELALEERQREREAEKREGGATVNTGEGCQDLPFAPTLLDKFERYKFLMELLDGTIGSAEASGAVALTVGFKYDRETRLWSGADVSDSFFAAFGDNPPVDVLGNGKVLEHLENRLKVDDEDGRVAEGLNMIVETYHGQDLTQILRESGDEDFKSREIVAKFLHLLGGF